MFGDRVSGAYLLRFAWTISWRPRPAEKDLADRRRRRRGGRGRVPATHEQKAVLAKLSPEQFGAAELAGEPILARLTTAPGTGWTVASS